MNHLKRISLVALVVLVAAAAPVSAGPGLHAGMTINPDNFLVGAHWSHPLEKFRLVPSVEAGFGDLTMVAGNLDLHYNFKTDSKLAPFAGGGMTLAWYDFDGGSDTEFGGSILGGLQITKEIFFEAKFGLGDVPDAWLFVGWQRP